MRLVEIFKEHNVIVKGKGTKSQYDQLFLLTQVNKEIKLEDLKAYVQKLQNKYPNRGFRLKKRGKYYIVDQEYRDGRKDRIPIYFDLDAQKVYVPSSYLKSRKKLANYLLMRALGTLGLAKVKYLQTI